MGMKAKKGLYFVAIGFIWCALWMGIISKPDKAEGEQKPIELRMATVVTAVHPAKETFDKWADELYKLTNGRLKIAVYPGGVLCPSFEVYNAVKSGIVHIGAGPSGFALPTLELNQFLGNCLAGFKTPHEVVSVWKRAMEEIPVLREEFKEVVFLLNYATMPMTISTKAKLIQSVEDLKGLMLRCPPGLEGVAKKWGIIPVTLPVADIYVALQKGTVHGYIGGVEMLEAMKLAEQVKYVTPLYMIYGLNFVVINKRTWDSLPTDIQKIISDTTEKVTRHLCDAYVKDAENAIDFARKSGVVFSEFKEDAWMKLYEISREALREAARSYEEKGKPGMKVYEYAMRVNKKPF